MLMETEPPLIVREEAEDGTYVLAADIERVLEQFVRILKLCDDQDGTVEELVQAFFS